MNKSNRTLTDICEMSPIRSETENPGIWLVFFNDMPNCHTKITASKVNVNQQHPDKRLKGTRTRAMAPSSPPFANPANATWEFFFFFLLCDRRDYRLPGGITTPRGQNGGRIGCILALSRLAYMGGAVSHQPGTEQQHAVWEVRVGVFCGGLRSAVNDSCCCCASFWNQNKSDLARGRGTWSWKCLTRITACLPRPYRSPRLDALG